MLKRLFCVALIGLTGASWVQAQPDISTAINPIEVDAADYLDRINLPDGFEISIYAEGMEFPRSLALSDNNVLYVGTLGSVGGEPVGKVYAIPDYDGDGKGDEVITILEDYFYPNGVTWHDGDLYVAEINRVVRFADIDNHLQDLPEPEVINDSLPSEYLHGWKYIDVGPDNKLYFPIGAPCNICELEDKFGSILRMNLDGSEEEVYATGVRNSVGFTWHPVSKDLWFTDNGRDLWGDNTPPEELNRVTQAGQHFGYPHRYGKDLIDEQFPTDMSDEDFTPAVLEMPAHTAGLGIEFYTGSQFPEAYNGQLFAAYHGSWNRNPPDGYNVRLMRFENEVAVSYEDFATGWLIEDPEDSSKLVFWGRPVDFELLPDGSMLLSDDHAGVVYKITYSD